MKLQSWIVVFAIIVIPIVLVMSLYIQVQINYVNLQGNYDTSKFVENLCIKVMPMYLEK